jgi:hypothetical protein
MMNRSYIVEEVEDKGEGYIYRQNHKETYREKRNCNASIEVDIT